MSNDALRRQAERFLAFALKAREAGNLSLADELTARAMDLFNEADSTADVSHTGRSVSPSIPTVPQEQQQQQGRMDRKEDGEGE
jgi:hypothetical protein